MAFLAWALRVLAAAGLTLAIVALHLWMVPPPAFGPEGVVMPGWGAHLQAFLAIAALAGLVGWPLGMAFDALEARSGRLSRDLLWGLALLLGRGKVTLGLALAAMAVAILREPDWRGFVAVFLVTLVGAGRVMGAILSHPGLVELVDDV